MPPPFPAHRAPSSTYRVQLHADFTFGQLEAILEYLDDLGISTIYASPITRAIKGSRHGYDVTDPLLINPEIGTEADLENLSRLLKEKDMNWLQDIVPNHMAYESNNPWIYDALERGPHSPYYRFFDIDGNESGELTAGKVMAPFLGGTLTECLQKGEIRLAFKNNGFVLCYFDQEYPVAILLYQWIATVAAGCPPGLLASFRELEKAALGSIADWHAVKKEWLEAVYAEEEYLSFISQRVHFFQDQVALTGELVQGQFYLLTHAHLASSRINYRRFFTVNSLICLRMEDYNVFSTYHEKIHAWYQKGLIQGLRIDHIDGLAAPRQYIGRVRALFGPDCYLVAEKILEEGEDLPGDWLLQGTTGYEFLSAASQLLTDADGSKRLLAFYQEEIIPEPVIYEDLVFEKKYSFLRRYMGGELDNLIGLLFSLPLLETASTQSKEVLTEALALLMASFPVYRVYPDTSTFPETSRSFIRDAFAKAKEKGPGYGQPLDFLQRLFEEEKENPGGGDCQPGKQEQKLPFRRRLMQFTGPLAAKGIEDTSFYLYHPFIAHNEVGDTPAMAGIPLAAFHEKMMARQASLPFSLNASTTHDTKRGEDSRIRLNWLSAIPDEWISSVRKWRKMNACRVHEVKGRKAPAANDEYLIYQSLLGGFPEDGVVTDAFRERFDDYLTKALREGKAETRWEAPDEEYERSCHEFVKAILSPGSPFLEDFNPFVRKVIRESALYSLSQLLIKLTTPGIPDIYQGAELWDLSFVDPDNRKPVDYTLRKRLLKKMKEEEEKGLPAVLDFVKRHQTEGIGKLFVLYKTLAYRKRHPRVFTEGDYLPLGTADGSTLSYMRRHGNDWVLVLAPLIRQGAVQARITVTLPVAEAPTEWTDAFTGEIFQRRGATLEIGKSGPFFPLALLIGKTAE
jgi:(1->4)-alpha-D-glucan 1-alpha-D-glucosylmutase